jgi:tetratricopeptide (TPR) repeat protein
MTARTRLADALHQSGLNAEAVAALHEAEEMQKQRQPEYPLLYSLSGFRYCDLLLDQEQVQDVKDRAVRTLEWFQNSYPPLSLALDNLSLGRAFLLEAQQPGTGDTTQAAEFFQRAVDGLRQAGQMDELPRGLLARAALHRVSSDYVRAERDLAEVFRIATRGPMGLYLADYHLESARLHLAQGNQDNAREHWEKAKAMIKRMGYHRRDKEVNEIAQQLR